MLRELLALSWVSGSHWVANSPAVLMLLPLGAVPLMVPIGCWDDCCTLLGEIDTAMALVFGPMWVGDNLPWLLLPL